MTKYTNEQLKELQSLSLDEKVAISLTRISEFINAFPNGVYVSYSGGKDSTVLLNLVRKIKPDIPVIFSNTGLEYPEIRNFALSNGAEMIFPKMSFVDVIKKYGYPIISKEVAEAIYYARRIVPRERERESYPVRRLMLLGKLPTQKQNNISQTTRTLGVLSEKYPPLKEQGNLLHKVGFAGKQTKQKQKELCGQRYDSDEYG